MKRRSEYSICHNGPLAYRNGWTAANSWRNRQYIRGYFLDPDTKAKIPCKVGDLTIFNLTTNSGRL